MAAVPSRMPSVFVGHGNPMNALELNAYTRAWRALGASLPRPRAILAVSAHWYLPGTAVTAMDAPRTIHDFGGFPRSLYEVRYPAPGDPRWPSASAQLLAPTPVGLDDDWGLDHGTWSVLCHMFPAADVPVVQLSLDETRRPRVPLRPGPAPGARCATRACWSWAAATSSTTCTRTRGGATRWIPSSGPCASRRRPAACWRRGTTAR